MNLEAYRGKIVILARGSCTFIDKIFMSQAHGAVGVLMLNTDDTPSKSTSGADAGALKVLMMGTDNSGREIHIPSMMIPKRFGDEVIACMYAYAGIQQLASAMHPDYERKAFQLEMLKYHIPPTSVTPTPTSPSSPSSSMLHPRVVGDLTRFFVTSMGGWTVEIEEKDQEFQLKVY